MTNCGSSGGALLVGICGALAAVPLALTEALVSFLCDVKLPLRAAVASGKVASVVAALAAVWVVAVVPAPVAVVPVPVAVVAVVPAVVAAVPVAVAAVPVAVAAVPVVAAPVPVVAAPVAVVAAPVLVVAAPVPVAAAVVAAVLVRGCVLVFEVVAPVAVWLGRFLLAFLAATSVSMDASLAARSFCRAFRSRNVNVISCRVF